MTPTTPKARPGWYTTAAVMASSLVFSVGALAIGLHANARSDARAEQARVESEQKWCSVVTTLDTAYRQTPPSTPTGVEVAARIAELRKQLACP